MAADLNNADRTEWLANAHTWAVGNLSVDRFRPVKFLGQGGQGMAGLWEQLSIPPGKTQFFVVKQSFNSLKKEADFYKLFNSTNSAHIPRMFHYYRKIPFSISFRILGLSNLDRSS